MNTTQNTTQSDKPLVLVTGGAGLIGTKLVRALVPDYRVVAWDIVPPAEPVEGSEWMKCDLTDDHSVAETLKTVRGKYGERIASIIHLAAYYDFSGEPSPMYEQLTVEGTRRLLRELHAQPCEVDQFVFSSTLLVMKPVVPGEALTESSPTQAEWEYPQSKLDTEAVLANESGNIPTVSVRLAGAYDEEGHSPPLTQQTKRIYERQLESHFFPGKVDHGQSFMHLDDVVSCFQAIIAHRSELPQRELFLIGEPEVMSYGELQDEFGRLLHGKEWTTLRIPKPVARLGAWAKEKMASDKEEVFIKPWMVDLADAHYPVDISHAKQMLGWEPRHRLRDTIPEMIQHLQKNPRRWYEINKLPLPENADELFGAKAGGQ